MCVNYTKHSLSQRLHLKMFSEGCQQVICVMISVQLVKGLAWLRLPPKQEQCLQKVYEFAFCYSHVVSITILDSVCAPDPTLVLTLPIIGAHLTPHGAHLIRTEEAKRLIKSGSFHVNNLLVESPLERLDPAKHILKGRFTVLRIGGFQIMY